MASIDVVKLTIIVTQQQTASFTPNILFLISGNVIEENLYAVRRFIYFQANWNLKHFFVFSFTTAIDNGEWGGPGSCPTRLCQCDLALSKCLRHHYCPKKRPVCVSSPFRLLQNLVMVFWELNTSELSLK